MDALKNINWEEPTPTSYQQIGEKIIRKITDFKNDNPTTPITLLVKHIDYSNPRRTEELEMLLRQIKMSYSFARPENTLSELDLPQDPRIIESAGILKPEDVTEFWIPIAKSGITHFIFSSDWQNSQVESAIHEAAEKLPNVKIIYHKSQSPLNPPIAPIVGPEDDLLS